jgi:hypothetical protein
MGGLPPEVIQKVVRANFGVMRLCYGVPVVARHGQAGGGLADEAAAASDSVLDVPTTMPQLGHDGGRRDQPPFEPRTRTRPWQCGHLALMTIQNIATMPSTIIAIAPTRSGIGAWAWSLVVSAWTNEVPPSTTTMDPQRTAIDSLRVWRIFAQATR